jgi:head-tail adaptor
MDAGKLDTQIAVVRLTKSQDEFGGFTSTEAVVATYWANLTYKDGNIKSENGQRQHFVEIELVMRKKTVDEIQDQDLIQVEGTGPKYRINSILEHEQDFYTTLTATKID